MQPLDPKQATPPSCDTPTHPRDLLLRALVAVARKEFALDFPDDPVPSEEDVAAALADVGNSYHYRRLLIELSRLAPTPDIAKWLSSVAS